MRLARPLRRAGRPAIDPRGLVGIIELSVKRAGRPASRPLAKTSRRRASRCRARRQSDLPVSLFVELPQRPGSCASTLRRRAEAASPPLTLPARTPVLAPELDGSNPERSGGRCERRTGGIRPPVQYITEAPSPCLCAKAAASHLFRMQLVLAGRRKSRKSDNSGANRRNLAMQRWALASTENDVDGSGRT